MKFDFEYNGIKFECMSDLIDYALELGKQDKKDEVHKLFDAYAQYVYVKEGYNRLDNAFDSAKYCANCHWAECLFNHHGDEDWYILQKILNLRHPVYGPYPYGGYPYHPFSKPYEYTRYICD